MTLLDSWPVILVVGVGDALIACHSNPVRAIDAVDGHRGEALVGGAIRVEVIGDSEFPE